MSNENILQRIQQMQYNNRGAAEALLIQFIEETFPLNVAGVQLNPSAVSLNSFNGFLTLEDGNRLFFKTHTESDNVIGEYYRASVLADAGYPVIQPVYSSTEAGKHLLIYDVIDDPSVFDVAWQVENGDDKHFNLLKAAQNKADDDLLELYKATLTQQQAQPAAQEPIHQLFHHRLAQGRLERFYGALPGQPTDQDIVANLPHGKVPMEQVRRAKWTINGQQYDVSLDDLIAQALKVLEPAQAGPAITGHGDAHNGNVFLRLSHSKPDMLYFDPAFAGQHHPLLDLVKPIFHNVFAMWMYYPLKKRDTLQITLDVQQEHWHVEHDYALHPVREMFLESKVQRTLKPILQHLSSEGELREDWRAYFKAGLFCCPFLTMNLIDSSRFPPEITLLGLTMAVEMGGESNGKHSRIDQVLDEVEASLSI